AHGGRRAVFRELLHNQAGGEQVGTQAPVLLGYASPPQPVTLQCLQALLRILACAVGFFRAWSQFTLGQLGHSLLPLTLSLRQREISHRCCALCTSRSMMGKSSFWLQV